ncbi:MAG: PIN domain-containing protein [Balneolaceae bacterium]
MKILFDTNVLLDVFLLRDPFYEASAQITGFAEQSKIEGWICSTTVTTIYYLLAKTLSRTRAEKHLKDLFKIFHVSIVNRVVLEDALSDGFKDYEDAVLHQSALHAGLDGIVTRNKKDFKKSDLPVYSPEGLLNMLDVLK